jgi:hypothetical protein
VGWARRLAAHPLVAAALAGGQVSTSWARHVCDWADQLPAGHRGDADRILLAAVAGGAQLADLSGLAEEMGLSDFLCEGLFRCLSFPYCEPCVLSTP